MKPINWFILGFVLTVLEVFIPGFVIFWFGIAGVVTGIVALFWPSLIAQIVIFAVLSGVMVLSAQTIARRWTRRSPARIGAERLDGARGLVVTAISPPEMGMVKVLGELWRAEAAVAVAPDRYVVVRQVVGNHLVVEPEAAGSATGLTQTGGMS